MSATLEDRAGDDHRALLGYLAHGIAAWAGNGFSPSESVVVFALARVWSVEEFLQADDICTGFGRLANHLDGFLDIRRDGAGGGHLDKCEVDGSVGFRHPSIPSCG
jgi:hypothetical protein